jgi:hypothetical protein
MNGDTKTPEQVIAEFKATEEAAKQANATPLPGATGAAFSPNQDIPITLDNGDKLVIRPIYNSDIKVLQMVEHPIYRGGFGTDMENVVGEPSWLLAWLLTQDVKSARTFAKNGKEAVLEAATERFGDKYQADDMLKISLATFEQVEKYFSTVLEFEQTDTNGEGSKKN